MATTSTSDAFISRMVMIHDIPRHTKPTHLQQAIESQYKNAGLDYISIPTTTPWFSKKQFCKSKAYMLFCTTHQAQQAISNGLTMTTSSSSSSVSGKQHINHTQSPLINKRSLLCSEFTPHTLSAFYNKDYLILNFKKQVDMTIHAQRIQDQLNGFGLASLCKVMTNNDDHAALYHDYPVETMLIKTNSESITHALYTLFKNNVDEQRGLFKSRYNLNEQVSIM